MSDNVAALLDEARDTAQQIVTCLFNRDRGKAAELAQGYLDGVALALVMADLVAYTHHRWAKATGIPRNEAWAELMLDIEEWRTNR